MTKNQKDVWNAKLDALLKQAEAMKADASREFHNMVGRSPLVSSLAAIETFVWAAKECIDFIPGDEELKSRSTTLADVEKFLSGFEDDESQTGINQLLAEVRKEIEVAK